MNIKKWFIISPTEQLYLVDYRNPLQRLIETLIININLKYKSLYRKFKDIWDSTPTVIKNVEKKRTNYLLTHGLSFVDFKTNRRKFDYSIYRFLQVLLYSLAER